MKQRKKQLFLTFFCSNPPKSAFPAFPIFNQIRHTAHFQTKTPGERLQLRHTRHRSILIENFTQHPHRRQSGQPNQIHRRFRVPRTLQHPSRDTFAAVRNAPLPLIPLNQPQSSAPCFMPVHHPRGSARPVSCYALFE